MPRPDLPPTPASSTNLLAKDSEQHGAEQAFILPPPAIHSAETSASSNASLKSDSSYRPISPSSSHKRPRTSEGKTKDTERSNPGFSLPPPPTRSRRIIQMKPGGSERKTPAAAQEKSDKKKTGGHSRTNSSTTAAGKKTARKTAHSIIERRRRSKMNEEFETLKEMVPACRGQSMHKLAILQAGIDYMRYLEKCVADMKSAGRGTMPSLSIPQSQVPTPTPRSAPSSISGDDDDDDDAESMQGIDEVQAQSPVVESMSSGGPSRGYTSSLTSPVIQPQTQQRPLARSTNTSALPSPSFGPRNDSWSSIDRPRLSYVHSVNTSPVILPDPTQDADQEASAALLMLNHDRRYSRSERPPGGGLSVKDLLSS